MRILVLGSDGYIGWPLTLSLLEDGHEVATLDNLSRRFRVRDVGSDSLTPILLSRERLHFLSAIPNYIYEKAEFNLGSHPNYIHSLLQELQPEVIVHLAEQPSAPWSMVDSMCAAITQQENVLGTLNLLWAIKANCPSAHLIKLGSMGEYGTPKCEIPEGKIPSNCLGIYGPDFDSEDIVDTVHQCPMAGLQFPRQPGSFYHASKVMDSINIEFACRNWGLTSTDIMQGVVYGLTNLEPHLLTRFDYDEYFGTAINRFCAQALINHPLTVYGNGEQIRSFLPLKDSIQCIKLIIKNPPFPGTYRTINQYSNIQSINYLAHKVARIAIDIGITSRSSISNIPNPRNENEDHDYITTNETLQSFGYKPSTNLENEISTLLKSLFPYTYRIKKGVILPQTTWSF